RGLPRGGGGGGRGYKAPRGPCAGARSAVPARRRASAPACLRPRPASDEDDKPQVGRQGGEEGNAPGAREPGAGAAQSAQPSPAQSSPI
uniref:Uncharacterized protein n=1 Tax=Varanus komodoensis TaxID=61221 RepID=A0A8D2LXY8_VARKO